MATMASAVFTALAETTRQCALPRGLLEDLVSAFRQDITVTRYATWTELLDYCRRSANPVGRLVLRIAGWRDDHLDAASDAVCTALQLTNFWQDLAIDWSRGRLYVPAETHEPLGATTTSLARREWTPAWRQALAECASRTRALFTTGRPVCDGVSGRLKWELRLTWLGGVRILDRLAQAEFDVFISRPALGPADVPVLAWQALRWQP
jgi:squalene synthase HpnC